MLAALRALRDGALRYISSRANTMNRGASGPLTTVSVPPTPKQHLALKVAESLLVEGTDALSFQ